jgi:cytochrome c551/c552
MYILAQRKIRKSLYQIIAILLVMPASAPVIRVHAEEALSPAEADVAKLIQQGRCFVCHDMTKTSLLGPPYTAIASRYANENKDIMADVLAQKIVDGGGLNWGQMVMVQNDQRVNWEEARVIAKWVLNLKPAADATRKLDK